MRATYVSNLAHQVIFSFEPEGLIYLSGRRYFGDGKMLLQYFRLDESYEKSYKREEAFTTPVFVYENAVNMFNAKQPEITLFDYSVAKREILIEKHSFISRKEFKRMQEDPLYFYLKYCHIRGGRQ